MLYRRSYILYRNSYILLYSAKFSRHLYFVDWPLKAISLHNVRGMTAYRKPRLQVKNDFRGLNFRVGLLTHEIHEN